MRTFSILVGLFALALGASPVLAHHREGHAGGPPNGDGPTEGPGNSGAAHWCKDNFADEGFENHGQCVSHYAQLRNGNETEDAEDSVDGDNDNDNDSGSPSDALAISDVLIRTDGTFRLRGTGAEDTVIVSIGGVSGLVVGFGEAEPASDGSWTIEGEWACQDNDDEEVARFRARDSNERVSRQATFPCDDLDV